MQFTDIVLLLAVSATASAAVIAPESETRSSHLSKRSPGKDVEPPHQNNGPSRAGPPRRGPSRAGPPRRGLPRAGPPRAELPRRGPSRAGPPRAKQPEAGPPRRELPRRGPSKVVSSKVVSHKNKSYKTGSSGAGSSRPSKAKQTEAGPSKPGPFGAGPSRPQPSGFKPSGPQSSDVKPSGPQPFGFKPFGFNPPGPKLPGFKPFGFNPPGPKPLGFKLGIKGFGIKNLLGKPPKAKLPEVGSYGTRSSKAKVSEAGPSEPGPFEAELPEAGPLGRGGKTPSNDGLNNKIEQLCKDLKTKCPKCCGYKECPSSESSDCDDGTESTDWTYFSRDTMKHIVQSGGSKPSKECIDCQQIASKAIEDLEFECPKESQSRSKCMLDKFMSRLTKN
ncbi:hypothetical protein BDV3_003305 [Batrachochytrium dendrobatidis]